MPVSPASWRLSSARAAPRARVCHRSLHACTRKETRQSVLARVSRMHRQARVLLRLTLALNWGQTMTGKDRGKIPTRAERRNVTTRAGGIWTEAERDRFIADL